MTKLGFLIGSSTFMIVTTFLVDSMEGIESSGIPVDTMPTESPTGTGGLLDAVLSFGATFYNIIAFNIDGIPGFVSLLFIIIAIGMGYIIIDIIKDLIPFT